MSKQIRNMDNVILTHELPEYILADFIEIANRYKDFIGEKIIDNGYLIKNEQNKVTITLQRGSRLYSIKLKHNLSHNVWNIDGEPIRWDNVEPLLFLN